MAEAEKKPALEKFEVRNRWTGGVQFTAEIEATPDTTPRVKLGLAVCWARSNCANLRDADLRDADLSGAYLRDADLRDADLRGADLSDAYLRGADLRGADLSDAYLSGADLRGANLRDAYLSGADLRDADLSGADLRDAYLSGVDLRDADLSGADLRPIIADYRFILSRAHKEVPALIAALKAGRVDGSTYEGECACLVGSLENAGATGLPHQASSPAERWFASIRKGDRPGDDSAGGFAAQKALEWAEEYCRDTGIELPAGELA